MESKSSTVRELERVIDAQKDYIRELRFEQRLKSHAIPNKTPLDNDFAKSDTDAQLAPGSGSKDVPGKRNFQFFIRID